MKVKSSQVGDVGVLRHELDGRPFVYSAEASEILGLPGIEYRHLRDLLRVVRGVDDKSALPAGWARFTLVDLAAMSIAIDLVGGPRALQVGGRRRLSPLKKCCDALREIGIDQPLIQVPLVPLGNRIIAHIDGILVDPTNGQLALGSVLEVLLDRVPDGQQGDDARARLNSDFVSVGFSTRLTTVGAAVGRGAASG